MTDLSDLHQLAKPHPVRAPRGSAITCKNWLIEAAYRMIQNNLDPEVAENPDALPAAALAVLSTDPFPTLA